MRICPKCGYRDNPLWRGSRYDFNANYMTWEDSLNQPELKNVTEKLSNIPIGEAIQEGPYIFYRRGKGGLWLYRVPIEDYKVSVEKRAKFVKGKQQRLFERLKP